MRDLFSDYNIETHKSGEETKYRIAKVGDRGYLAEGLTFLEVRAKLIELATAEIDSEIIGRLERARKHGSSSLARSRSAV